MIFVNLFIVPPDKDGIPELLLWYSKISRPILTDGIHPRGVYVVDKYARPKVLSIHTQPESKPPNGECHHFWIRIHYRRVPLLYSFTPIQTKTSYEQFSLVQHPKHPLGIFLMQSYTSQLLLLIHPRAFQQSAHTEIVPIFIKLLNLCLRQTDIIAPSAHRARRHREHPSDCFYALPCFPIRPCQGFFSNLRHIYSVYQCLLLTIRLST